MAAFVLLITLLVLLRDCATAVRGHNVGQQEVRDAPIGVDLILEAGETVPFVFVNLGVDGSSTLLDRLDHLLRF